MEDTWSRHVPGSIRTPQGPTHTQAGQRSHPRTLRFGGSAQGNPWHPPLDEGCAAARTPSSSGVMRRATIVLIMNGSSRATTCETVEAAAPRPALVRPNPGRLVMSGRGGRRAGAHASGSRSCSPTPPPCRAHRAAQRARKEASINQPLVRQERCERTTREWGPAVPYASSPSSSLACARHRSLCSLCPRVTWLLFAWAAATPAPSSVGARCVVRAKLACRVGSAARR